MLVIEARRGDAPPESVAEERRPHSRTRAVLPRSKRAKHTRRGQRRSPSPLSQRTPMQLAHLLHPKHRRSSWVPKYPRINRGAYDVQQATREARPCPPLAPLFCVRQQRRLRACIQCNIMLDPQGRCSRVVESTHACSI